MPFERRLLKYFDWPLLATVMALCLYGLVALASATHASHSLSPVKRQVVWIFLGLVAMFLVLLPDYSFFVQERKLIYGGALALLVLVLIVGKVTKGAQRWLSLGPLGIQPSEFMKLAAMITLAAYFSPQDRKASDLKTLLGSLPIVLVPMLLVYLQPDLGTSLVLVAIWFGMAFMAGARPSHLAGVFFAGLLVFGLAWHFDLLHTYQKKRILAFLNPHADPLRTGYHLLQSQIAIGSGRLLGKGLFHGTQSQLRFIPAQHTDFIFTLVGEELGFVGSVVLLALFAYLFWRVILIAAQAQDRLGMLICVGVLSLWAFHVFVNIGVSLGLVPPTGLPLPFMSYGGSAMLVNMIGVGLVLSVGMRRQKIVF